MTEASTVVGGSLSPIGAGFNLVNTIIGSGILALPYALKEAGFYFGMFILVVVALLTYVSLNTLVYSGRRTGLYKYEAVSQAALGRAGHHILAFALGVNSIGSCISYLMIVGDTASAVAQHVFGQYVVTSRPAIITIAAVVFTLPLLFFRTLEPLVRASVASTLCLPFIVGIVAIRGPSYRVEPAPQPVFGPSVLPAIGVIAFAYSCTQTCYQSYSTLQSKTLSGWKYATAFATSLSVVVYLAFSVVSYQAFGQETQPNLLNNFAHDDATANVARVLLAFSLTLTYPMQFYPIRDLLATTFLGPLSLHGTRGERYKFYALIVVVFTSTLAVALAVDDLGVVFKLIGTAASSVLVFGLPGIIYLRVVSPYFAKPEAVPLLAPAVSADIDDVKHISEPQTTAVSVLLLALGVCVFVIGTWTTINEYM
ncbi:hypothetical protein IWW56_000562 [Coemansia sp. RSA 2131]|nr:hypothetical protein IWW56_000562 [Coemansia sp. RSA 2131]